MDNVLEQPRIKINLDLAESQLNLVRAIQDPKYLEVVIYAGRNWGKDLTLAITLFDMCVRTPNLKILFVCPVYKQVANFIKQAFRFYNKEKKIHALPQYSGDQKIWTLNKSSMNILFFNGSEIQGVSVDNPENARSFRADIMVLNECRNIDEETISLILEPILNTPGKTIWVTTPNGKDHVFKKYQEGIHDPTHKHYDHACVREDVISFSYTYLDNPKYGGNVEKFKKSMSARNFSQEIMCEILDDSAVFSNLENAFYTIEEPMTNSWRAPVIDGRTYVAGLDVAKIQDFSVLVILDQITGQMVAFERFSKMDYHTQAERILSITKEYNNAAILMDGTGVGKAVYEILAAKAVGNQEIIPKDFTNTFKEKFINALQIRIERESAWMPNITFLVSELRNLSIKVSDFGANRYTAPSGKHDDCVMSLGLANYIFVLRKADNEVDDQNFEIELF